MKLLKIDDLIINLGTVTHIDLDPSGTLSLVKFYFANSDAYELVLEGEQAERARDYFENHADCYAA